jgi:hypothetical protein
MAFFRNQFVPGTLSYDLRNITRVILTDSFIRVKSSLSLLDTTDIYMNTASSTSCIAFVGVQRIAAGDLHSVAAAVKQRIDAGEQNHILIFDDMTSEPVEVDFRGTLKAMLHRLPQPTAQEAVVESEAVARAPGRPKLGVTAREVTLLPRHWEWLAAQPGGASVALRKLVEEASRINETKDRIRKAQESAYRFMSAMAGNLPGYEDAVRALFAGKPEQFSVLTEAWLVDVRDHARRLALRAFGVTGEKS